ncbi:MAG: hypothetical protein FJZ01_20620 [Candidatus Sericytochromatia bacterium]|nr:hypothetical protein [Candidatus Tanganyikabacteria bacterium]
MKGPRARLLGAIAAGIAALAGCSASPLGADAWVGAFLNGDRPRAVALVRFDGATGGTITRGRGVQTIPANASKVKLVIYDPLGFIVGGLPLTAIPSSKSFVVPALPAGVVLKFDMRMTDSSNVEVAKAIRKNTLVANAVNEVESTVYMDAPQLFTDTVTVSSGQESSQDVIAVQFRLADGSHYRFTPSVTAVNAANQPVSCSPTYKVTAGDRNPDNTPGENVSATGAIMTAGTGQRFDVKARVTANCGATAKTITRYLKAEQVATVSVGVQ